MIGAVTAGSAAGPGAARTAATHVMRRTGGWFAALWLIGMALRILSQPAAFRSPEVTWSCYAVCCGAGILVLLRQQRRPWIFAAALALTFQVQIFSAVPDTARGGSFHPLVSWICLAGLCIGFFVAVKPAIVALAGFAALSALNFVIAWHDVSPAMAGTAVLLTAVAMAFGLTVVVATAALNSVADAEDEANAAELDTQIRAGALRARADEWFRLSRALHDTVINTFGVMLVPDQSPDSAARIRSRCGADLTRLDAMRDAAGAAPASPADQRIHAADMIVEGARLRAAERGIALGTFVVGDVPEVPPAVLEAMTGAIEESLGNIAKHSEERVAQLRVVAGPDEVRIRLAHPRKASKGDAVTAAAPSEGGIALSIHGRCRKAGVDSDVRFTGEGSAIVDLKWQRPLSEREGLTSQKALLASALIPMTARMAVVLLVLNVIAILTEDGTDRGWWPVAYMAVVIAMTAAAILRARSRFPIGDLMSACLCVAAAVVLVVPILSPGGCERIGGGSWAVLGSMVMLIVMTLLCARQIWTLVGAGAFVASLLAVAAYAGSNGACPQGVVTVAITDGAVLFGVYLLRRLIERLGREAQAEIDAAAASEMAATSEEHRRIVAERVLGRSLDIVRPLLQQISDGTADPLSPQVRAVVALEEPRMRALIRLGPELGALGDLLTEAVWESHARGVGMRIAVPEEIASPDEDVIEALAEDLGTFIVACKTGETLSVTLLRAGAGGSLAVIIPGAQQIALASAAVPDLTVIVDPDDTQTAYVLTWP